MLTLVGLGLRDGDISRRGIDAIASADAVFAEFYTNSIEYDLAALEDETGADITVLDRGGVEDDDRVFRAAQDRDVAFLVSGDPLTATTHQDVLFRARDAGIETEIVHAPSILTAVAETGLSIYKFGRTTTLPEPYDGAVPDSPFDVIRANRDQGLHTLLLLDIGMEIPDALDIVADRMDGPFLACSELGTEHRRIVYGDAATLRAHDFGLPACLIIPGDLSDNEQERLDNH